MEIERIPGATRTLGVDQGYKPLPIRDERQEGISVMLSQWRPNAEELAKLMLGAPIYLSIMGTQHPPVQVMVGSPPLSAGKMDVEGGTAPSQELYRYRVWEVNAPDPATNRSRHVKEFDAPNYENAIQQACIEWKIYGGDLDAERI